MATFEDFQKIQIKVGKIISAEAVEGSAKLLKLQVDFGKDEAGNDIVRQICAGIAKFYPADSLAGKEAVFVFNLEPKVLAGVESNGMILAASSETGPVLLMPDKEVPPGAGIK